MKLIALFIVMVFCSCKEKKKPHVSTAEEWAKVANDYPADTTIQQDIWYYQGRYCMQTWVKTRRQQAHFSSNKPINISIQGDTYAEYNKDTSGTFDFIAGIKSVEYLRADSFVKLIKEETLRKIKIKDSINFLNSIKPY